MRIPEGDSKGADPTLASDITVDDLLGSHRIILGRRGISEFVSCDGRLAGGAHATFDEFAIYDFGGHHSGTVKQYDSTKAAPAMLASNRWQIGRYYRESVYANDPLDPTKFPGNPGLFPGNTAAQWFSGLITLGPGPVTIQSLAWTQIVPRGLKAPLPAGGQAGWDGDPDTGAAPGDGRIVFDLVDATGTAYLKDTSSTPQPINTLFTQDASSPVGRTVNAPFRLHAVFRPNLSDSTVPILDPLTLDDVTLLYQLSAGSGVSSWQEGE